MSVGAVCRPDYLKQRKGRTLEFLLDTLKRNRALWRRIEHAKLVGSEVRVTGNYSYDSARMGGPGWVLVGDAFGFLDPLYSSGVLLALTSGQMAADAICEALARGDTSRAALGKWEGEFTRGMDRMRRLVCEFYDGFSFGRFVKKHPDLKGLVTDVLIGDLFKDDVDALWAPMDELRREMAQQQTGAMPA